MSQPASLSPPTIIPAQPGWSVVKILGRPDDPGVAEEEQTPVVAWAIQVVTSRDTHVSVDVTAPMLHEQDSTVVVPVTPWGTLPSQFLLRTPAGDYQVGEDRFESFAQAATSILADRRRLAKLSAPQSDA